MQYFMLFAFPKNQLIRMTFALKNMYSITFMIFFFFGAYSKFGKI